MKRLVIAILVSLVSLVSTAIIAGPPAKTELTFSGSYVNPKEGQTLWIAGASMLFPLDHKGIFLLGPELAIASEDEFTSGGASFEVNIPGNQHGGFFAGVVGVHYLDSLEDQDQTAGSYRGGIKLPISDSGLIKFYLEKGFYGRAEDADLTGALAAVIKF